MTRITAAGNPEAGCGSISTAWKMLGHPGLWRYREAAFSVGNHNFIEDD